MDKTIEKRMRIQNRSKSLGRGRSQSDEFHNQSEKGGGRHTYRRVLKGSGREETSRALRQ
jgi:hypothetical protein